MTLKGTCIGGPWHGRQVAFHTKRPWWSDRFAFSSRAGIWYVYLQNEFGDWWVVE